MSFARCTGTQFKQVKCFPTAVDEEVCSRNVGTLKSYKAAKIPGKSLGPYLLWLVRFGVCYFFVLFMLNMVIALFLISFIPVHDYAPKAGKYFGAAYINFRDTLN